MILSWKLWRALHRPPLAHIFYRRARSTSLPLFSRLFQIEIDNRWWKLLGALVLVYLFLRWGLTSLLMIFFVLPGVLILAFIMFPVALPLITTLVGGYWSSNISQTILREHDSHTYDLLCVGPNGTLGANWAVASSSVHQLGWFSWLYYGTIASLLLGALGVVLMTAVFGLLALSNAPVEDLVSAIRTLLELISLLGAFWLHYIHSVVLCVLVGLVMPTYMGHDAPWAAFIFYQAAQVMVYGLFVLIFHLLSPLTETITPDLWWAYLSVPIFYLVVLAVLREGLLVWLWGFVSMRLNAGPAERKFLLRNLNF